jgi:hypothetical protein
VPVSKKRKPKQNKRTTPPKKTAATPTSGGSAAAAGKADGSKKKKLTKQQIAIYVISVVMILSLAIGYLVGNSRGRSGVIPDSTPTVAAAGQTPEATQAAPTAESSEGK